MSTQDKERREATDLLQQLRAAFSEGTEPEGEPLAVEASAPAPVNEPKEKKTAEEAPKSKPTRKTPQKRSKPSAAPAAILALTENTPDAAPAVDPKPAPAAKASEQSAPAKPTRTTAKKEAPNGSVGTTMPKSAPSPFLVRDPSADQLGKKTGEPQQAVKTSAVKPRVRPNTTKVPPRKRSGQNTGAIRPKGVSEPVNAQPIVIKPRTDSEAKPSPAVDQKPFPAVDQKPSPAVDQKPSPAVDQKPSPAVKNAAPAERETPKVPVSPVADEKNAPKAVEPEASAIPAPEEEKSATEKAIPEKTDTAKTPEQKSVAEPRPASSVIVDFDGSSKSTVEPIENVEAAETVSEPVKKKFAGNSRRAKKQRKTEEGLDATAIIAKRTGLDESDIALIFELGYENELGRLVGYETLKKLKYEHLRGSRADTSDYYAQAFGYRGREYTSATPREQVLAAYHYDRRNLIIRIALMTLLSLVLFIVDFPTLLGGVFPTYAAKFPYLFPAIGLAFFGVAVFLMRGRILGGWRAFLRFAPSPYSAVSVAVPLMLIYSLAALIGAKSGTLLPMNFAAVLSLLFLSVCDAIRIADEIRAFRVISEPGDKTVLEEAEPRKKKLRQGNRTVKILNDEAGESLYRVRSTHEIVGFFRRMNDLSAASRPFMRLTVFLVICAVAGGITASLLLDNPLRGVLVAAATLMFSVPVSATFLFFDPLRRANRRLVSRRSVLVGEGSVNEYSDRKTVIFNDTETFRAKRQTQIALKDGDDFRRDMRLASILFRKLGGTLSTIGDATAGKEEEAPDPTVNLIRLTETGVEALVENRYRLLAGDAAFLTHSGIEVPKESTDRAVIRSRGVSILYVAVNGTLKLTYEVAYTMSHSFRDVIALLAQTETTLAVQSYDPNLNDAFLHVGFADGDEVVRVIKPAQFELPTPAEITDTGAVTLDGPLATAYPLRAASLIVQARRTGFRALLASILPGALIAFFAVWNLSAKLLPLLPLMAVGYRAVWFGVSWLISAFSLDRHAVFDDTRENLANEDQPL